MLDAELRALERSVRQSPADGALSRKLLQALRRAGRVASDAPPGSIEAVPNPGFAEGDLALVARRAHPRAAFEWLPEMDALVGDAARIRRLARDGLGAVLEGPSVLGARWPGDAPVGRSFGWASLVRVP